jgi:hypothetical protein
MPSNTSTRTNQSQNQRQHQRPSRPLVSKRVTINPAAMRDVIGKDGATVKGIARMCRDGCRIQRAEDANGNWIEGCFQVRAYSQSALLAAEMFLKKKATEVAKAMTTPQRTVRKAKAKAPVSRFAALASDGEEEEREEVVGESTSYASVAKTQQAPVQLAHGFHMTGDIRSRKRDNWQRRQARYAQMDSAYDTYLSTWQGTDGSLPVDPDTWKGNWWRQNPWQNTTVSQDSKMVTAATEEFQAATADFPSLGGGAGQPAQVAGVWGSKRTVQEVTADPEETTIAPPEPAALETLGRKTVSTLPKSIGATPAMPMPVIQPISTWGDDEELPDLSDPFSNANLDSWDNATWA